MKDTLESSQPMAQSELILAGFTRALSTVLVPIGTLIVLGLGYQFLRETDAPQWVQMIVAIVWGVGGVAALFLVADFLLERLSIQWRTRLTPVVFVGPALALLAWFLVVPMLRTIYASFFDAKTINFVGLENYIYAFTDSSMLRSFQNNVLWIVLGTGLSVGLGLLIALLADRTHARFEAIIGALIFLPSAISMVGASVIWRFVYAFAPAGAPQVGVLNAVYTALGGEPQAWLMDQPLNNFLLIVIWIWLRTGFAMVILSAAVKGIPAELLEAGRLDGASEFQLVWKISIPYIRGSIITAATMVLILTLKVFDIVFAMTGGNYNTEVIASKFYDQMFGSFQYGRGAAIAIVLLLVVLPLMTSSMRQFSEQSEAFQ
jgi:alpha-glucoside transport system permease protein